MVTIVTSTIPSAVTNKSKIKNSSTTSNLAVAYLAFGCFWEDEYEFECSNIPSVDKLGTEDPPGHCNTSVHSVSEETCVPHSTVVGYMGGHGDYPDYDTNVTSLNYSETLRLIYDPQQLSFERVMENYWKLGLEGMYNPCEPPYESNYAWRVFATSEEQRRIALASRDNEAKKLNCSLQMDVLNASEWIFWKAEEHHQQYNYKIGIQC